jgi:hypothetical protein
MSNIKQSGLHKLFFNYTRICVVNSQYVFLPQLAFSNSTAVEFCVCEDERLIGLVITNHVHCVELPALTRVIVPRLEL